MITWIGIVTLAIAAITWWTLACGSDRGQHSGGGAGTLTVAYLLHHISAETPPPGRHRRNEP